MRSPKKQFKRTGEKKQIKIKMNEAYFSMKEHEDPQHIIHGAERKSGFIIIHSRLRVTVVIEALQLFKKGGEVSVAYNFAKFI